MSNLPIGPQPKLRVQSQSLQPGQFVLDPAGKIGMLIEISALGRSLVNYGAGGPGIYWYWKVLTPATAQQIADAGLSGVGHKEPIP